MAETEEVEFLVLGPLAVTVGGEPARLGGPRPRALLGALLAQVGQAVSATNLIDQIWGDAPPATATAALQMHVSALRKVLGDRLVTTPAGYLLDATVQDVDAGRFEATIAAARRQLTERPARAAADLAGALALWRGEPYTGVPAGSDVAAARLRLAELRLSALEDRFDAELTLGRHARIVAELGGLVVGYPVRERLAKLYLLALYRCGRIGDAQEFYRELCRRLDAELGLEPGGDIVALARAVDRRDPTLDPPTTIPVPPSRFIGRRGALEQLANHLGTTRLLTVTGPGGSGKTRLALELAKDTAIDHPDGVYVVELATSPPGSSVADRVATVLRVRARTDEPLAVTLVAQLHDCRALILLDNCEHLIDGCAKLAAELLSHCAGLRILATSREPLGVTGERVWPLAGLGMPAEGDSPADAARTESVRLLADRGAAARAGFTIDRNNIAIAGQLCRWLDGLPLAIELAAAQLRTMSLAELTAHIGRQLGTTLALADRRSRTTPDRHHTMRAAIDWSYRLLIPAEQVLFRRLSVFAGGCDSGAAERIGDETHTLLARLVDQSILIAEQHEDGTRYRMLELVREYATERLVESGEADDLRHKHAAWCAELAGSAEQFGGPNHVNLMRRLGFEEANLRAAMKWCLGEGADPVRALEIASPLWWYWWARGLMAEGRNWLRRALAAADPTPSLLRGSALRAAAALTRNSGDFAEARQLGEECLTVYQALADTTGATIALGGLCVTAIAQQDYEAALRYAKDSRDLANDIGDQRRYASALNNIGLIHRIEGRRAEAVPPLTEALQIWHEINDGRGEAAATGNLGILARQSGDPTESRRLGLRSLALYVEVDILEGVLDALDALASLDIAAGRPAAGLRLLTVVDRERDRLGAPLFIEDEIADRKVAMAAAHEALGGARAETIIAAARDLPLSVVTDALLPDEPQSPDRA
ncbi:MAG TPA: BTAD domain-containing putative transcriptional regulator [Pseudonocardiaceae bacterium]|nr:BTAD domain-containing putative transcriptional regulator [Pseudonocardiaceae bacterium]